MTYYVVRNGLHPSRVNASKPNPRSKSAQTQNRPKWVNKSKKPSLLSHRLQVNLSALFSKSWSARAAATYRRVAAAAIHSLSLSTSPLRSSFFFLDSDDLSPSFAADLLRLGRTAAATTACCHCSSSRRRHQLPLQQQRAAMITRPLEIGR